MAHKWSTHDDLTAFYVCKFGPDRSASSKREVADRLGIPAGSFNMRVGNFKALLGLGGLDNYATQSEAVYNANKDESEAELRESVLRGFVSRARG